MKRNYEEPMRVSREPYRSSGVSSRLLRTQLLPVAVAVAVAVVTILVCCCCCLLMLMLMVDG